MRNNFLYEVETKDEAGNIQYEFCVVEYLTAGKAWAGQYEVGEVYEINVKNEAGNLIKISDELENQILKYIHHNLN